MQLDWDWGWLPRNMQYFPSSHCSLCLSCKTAGPERLTTRELSCDYSFGRERNSTGEWIDYNISWAVKEMEERRRGKRVWNFGTRILSTAVCEYPVCVCCVCSSLSLQFDLQAFRLCLLLQQQPQHLHLHSFSRLETQDAQSSATQSTHSIHSLYSILSP